MKTNNTSFDRYENHVSGHSLKVDWVLSSRQLSIHGEYLNRTVNLLTLVTSCSTKKQIIFLNSFLLFSAYFWVKIKYYERTNEQKRNSTSTISISVSQSDKKKRANDGNSQFFRHKWYQQFYVPQSFIKTQCIRPFCWYTKKVSLEFHHERLS